MDNSKVAVSVIIPVYNTEHYFDRCIRSIMSQTLQEIEIIVVNDCSPGDIEQRIKSYIKEDPRIRYIKTDSNKKVGGALNIGKKYANGEYLMFCDSDDWLDYTTLEAMYKCTENGKNDLDIINCGLYRDYNDGTTRWDHQYTKDFSVSGHTALKVLAHQVDYGFSISVSPANKIYRKTLVMNMDFIENICYDEPVFNFFAMKNARRVGFSSEGKYTYFCRPGSLIQSITDKHIQDFEMVFSIIKKELHNAGEYDVWKDSFISFTDFFFNIIVEQIYDHAYDETARQKFLLKLMQAFGHLVSIEDYLLFLGSQKFRWKVQGDMLINNKRIL